MPSARATRLGFILLLACWIGLLPARATVVVLKDGTVYEARSIRPTESGRWETELEYGSILLDPDQIKSIDGVDLGKPARAAPPQPIPVSPPPPATDGPRAWHMEVFLLGTGLFAALWIGTMIWVQRDAAEQFAEVKQANTLVLALPILGWLIYLNQRRRAGRGEEPADQHAPPVRRRLFGRRPAQTEGPQTAQQRLSLQFFDADGNPMELKKSLPGMSGVETAREVLSEAIISRASDIHIEPREKGWRVRFRVDGILQERQLFDRVDNVRLVAALKTLAQIDVAEKRRAQDGRFRVRTTRGEVDFRAATSHSIHGEKLVLRLLERKTGLITLPELGMPAGMLERFQKVIHLRSGMILATGPTGSGKTSTLYAALTTLDARHLNIMTIEDPVEYEIEGATQLPVNARAGVTYESGLRSILRQDPDVIFVGEMRDREATAIALRAALTGHLVFSSLHAKDTISAVARLLDLDVEEGQLTSALLAIVAQRLVRVLCPQCRLPAAAQGDELADLGVTLPAGREIYRPTGCDRCEQTGYLGRTGIFELLVIDDLLRRAIHEGADEIQLWELARRGGTRPFREDGADKILRGITSVEEVRGAG